MTTHTEMQNMVHQSMVAVKDLLAKAEQKELEQKETQAQKPAKKLVVAEDCSIHRKGCRDARWAGFAPQDYAETFSGSTIADLAAWYVQDWYEQTGETVTFEDTMKMFRQDVKPCTGLK